MSDLEGFTILGSLVLGVILFLCGIWGLFSLAAASTATGVILLIIGLVAISS